MSILAGKKVLIFGVANERSIAWGIAQSLKAAGADVALSYLNDTLKKRVEPLAEKLGASFIFEMDVTKPEHFEVSKKLVQEKWGKVDVLVHSLAFAKKEDLQGRFVDTSRDGFLTAMEISAYSLVSLSRNFESMMEKNSSIMAMTYHGSQKVCANYNVMGVAKAALESSARYLANDLGQKGIKVNCISAGAIKTLASSGVAGIKDMFKAVEEFAPLRENVTPSDVGGTALYLASDMSNGVTGQIMYVDSGISILAK